VIIHKVAVAVAVAGALSVGLVAAPAEAATVKSYENCAALNKVYPHGVGKNGAKDRTSGKRVTNFKVSNTLYAHNDGGSKRYAGERDLDRDNDGIACEKR
jgi:uncharacterized membrane protein